MALAHSGVRGLQMRFQLARAVGVLLQVRPVGVAVAEQHVHHRAGERAVRARPQHEAEVGLLDRAVAVDVDGDDLRAALLAWRASRASSR